MSFAALSLASGLIKGIVGMYSHNKYANVLEKQKMYMPESITAAQNILTERAYAGLPNEENIRENIMGGFRSNYTAMKELGTPSQMVGLLNKSYRATENQLMALGMQDAAAKDRNQLMLSNFLASVKSPIEQRINQFEIEKELGVARERMAGTQSLVENTAQGLGGFMQAKGQEKYLDILSNYYTAMAKRWGTEEDVDTSVYDTTVPPPDYFMFSPIQEKKSVNAGYPVPIRPY